MFNRKTDYALNKKEKNIIVYKDAYDNLIILTASDFASVKEFRKWKNWKTMKDHTEEKKEHIHNNHTVSMTGLEEFLEAMSPIEETITPPEQDSIESKKNLLKQIRASVTEIQFRRMWMYYVEGMDTYEIAKIENRCHQAISQSLYAARKKILKKLSKDIDKPL